MRCFSGNISAWFRASSARQHLGDGILGDLLDEVGEERFRLKAGRFAADIREWQPLAVLYRGVTGALGYTKNKEPFEDLTIRLPVATPEGFCRGKPFEEWVQVLKTLFLGKAGLLKEGGDLEMERLWRCSGNGEPMRPSCWRIFRVPAENHPARRLTGTVHILASFMSGVLLEGVLGLGRFGLNMTLRGSRLVL